MMAWMRGSISAAGVTAVALVLAACQSTGSNTANLNTIGAPQNLQPVQNSTVQQGTLPAIGATGTPAPGLSGQPVLGGVPVNQTAMVTPPPSTSFPTTPGTGLPPVAPSTPSAPGSSIVSLNGPAAPAIGSGPEGVWNVTAGSSACRLNLPRTAKTGTSYFRASAPG